MSDTVINRSIIYIEAGEIDSYYTVGHIRVYTCSRCHALIADEDRKDHTAWHKLHNDGWEI